MGGLSGNLQTSVGNFSPTRYLSKYNSVVRTTLVHPSNFVKGPFHIYLPFQLPNCARHVMVRHKKFTLCVCLKLERPSIGASSLYVFLSQLVPVQNSQCPSLLICSAVVTMQLFACPIGQRRSVKSDKLTILYK